MTEAKFSELWEQIGNSAQDIINTCADGTVMCFDKKERLQFEYEKLKEVCKKNHLMPAIGRNNDTPTPRMDRHKVASCIAGAIIKTRLLERKTFSVNEQKRISHLANETLALFSALAIVKSFICSDVENELNIDATLKNDFAAQGFIFPTPRHDDYLPWLLFLLQESNTIGFNVLSFSNILYLIEEYTFLQLELNNFKRITNDQTEVQ